MTQIELEFAPNIEDLSRLEEELESFVEQVQLPPKFAMQLNLVLEELLTNTISYGCIADRDYWLRVKLAHTDTALHITLLDNAEPFDPTTVEDVDVGASMDERRIGGLGIHIVKSLVDEIAYERVADTNKLTLIKHL